MDTHLRNDGRFVDTVVVLPPVKASLRGHGGQIDVHAGQQVTLRETQQVFQSVPGAPGGGARAALQRDAGVPPRGCQVEMRGDEAVVRRRVREEDDAHDDQSVGDCAEAESEKHLLLEAAPLSQERSGFFEEVGLRIRVCSVCAHVWAELEMKEFTLGFS